MNKIRILDTFVASKIAAGEVIDRPVSVVKELVENSLDANSTKIQIDILDGGLKSICISDNGNGIATGDISLAFQRYATSKISSFDDIYALNSFGFRGEALYSIASVSYVEMISGEGFHLPAARYSSMPNNDPVISEDKPLKGTIIKIYNLFSNIPARKKFMKSISYEFSLIHNLISTYSLAYPKVTFILTHQKKEIYSTIEKNSTELRLFDIYGKKLASHLIHFSKKDLDNNIFIELWCSDSTITLNNRKSMNYFINGRLIKSKDLNSLLDIAFQTYLVKGRFPILLLKLELPSDQIDINVHPAKTEIEFIELSKLENLLINSIRDEIWSNVLPHDVINYNINPSLGSESKTNCSTTSKTSVLGCRTINNLYPVNMDSMVTALNNDNLSVVMEPVVHSEYCLNDTNDNIQLELFDKIKELHLIGQLNKTFILAQNEDGLYIIDQHTCHERILFEKYIKSCDDNDVKIQSMLVKEDLHISPIEENSLTENIVKLRNLGFIFEKNNDRHYFLVGIPDSLLFIKDIKSFIKDLIFKISVEPSITISKLREEVITMASCKDAIKASYNLSYAEQEKLIRDLLLMDNPYACPHGRPTIIKITMNELYRMFERGSYKN